MKIEVKLFNKYEIITYSNNINDDKKEFRRWEINIDEVYISLTVFIC